MANYCVIGSGRQGTAAAYDIVRFGSPSKLTIIDNNEDNLKRCESIIKELTDFEIDKLVLDIQDKEKILLALKDVDIFLSSVPYPLNPYLTDIAIESKTHMVDLGGHTQNVIKQIKRSSEAKDAGITIVPDCGMGPGMNVSMALLSMEDFDVVKEVRVWDGGLPLKPTPPWNYNLFFNIEGLTNEYDGNAYFIRDAKVTEVPCFEDLEILDFPDSVGKLEAAVTSGGLSTMPWTYEGEIELLENKTLRYLGHWNEMILFRELGLFSRTPLEINNIKIVPREFYHRLLEPKLVTKEPSDICIMRTESIGIVDGDRVRKTVDCVEYFDKKTGFLAMEQWTGYHASMVMQHIMNGKIETGAIPIEKAMSGSDFYKYAINRKYNIRIDSSLV